MGGGSDATESGRPAASLAAATTRFGRLPDGGWVEVDVIANRKAHETAATLGLDGLSADARRLAPARHPAGMTRPR